MFKDLNLGFIKALIRRDLWKYFTNPTGYVFITLFIFLSAVAAFWPHRFFLNNLANLDQLNNLFPYLLVFFIPALTMGVWSEERKEATDELLFTLPATSLEVVCGKYTAVLGIYTASLILSFSHVLILAWLGSPDLGIMLSNYLGYWFAGGALIAVGMIASLLTANATIAFILGALLCAFLVFLKPSASLLSNTLGAAVEPLSIGPHFQDFASGIISFSAILYFCSVVAVGLFINIILVDRRHWPRTTEGYPTWSHYTVRTLALVIGLAALTTLVTRIGIRIDATSERLHSLSSQTKGLVRGLDVERPVFIQAFVSPEVREAYVQTRSNLLGTLRQLDSLGGATVQVRIEDTVPYSSAAREAREKFSITPTQVPNLGDASAGFVDVFMGLAFTCGAEEQVIPFLDRGLSVEYELARSLRVVANTQRKKIGVVTTEAKLFGGFDFQSFRSSPAWPVVDELKKQYEVVQVNPTGELPEDLDGLMVALPSSLSQEELDTVRGFIESGIPALLLVDPMPVINLGLSPSEQAGANQNPFMRNQGPPPKQKGDIQGFLTSFGVSWDKSIIVWDTYNPHPDLEQLPPEVIFVGRGNENANAFNAENNVSAQLQELVMLYPGTISPAPGSDFEFQPLIRSSFVSGRLSYFQLVQRSFLGVSLNRNLPHRPDGSDYVLAAMVTKGSPPAEENEEESEEENAEETEEEQKEENSEETAATDGPPKDIRLVVIADLDFISEQFFQIRERGPENLNFDNVTLFLNAMDILVGDESFVSLRNKRVRHRTLERVEAQTREFIETRIEEEGQAEAEADKALAEAQKNLDQRVEEVRSRPELDDRTKQIMARNIQEVESRKFEVLKASIEAEKEAKVHASRENLESQRQRIQSNIKTLAVVLPPIPVLVLGILIFLRRQRREREGESVARLLKG